MTTENLFKALKAFPFDKKHRVYSGVSFDGTHVTMNNGVLFAQCQVPEGLETVRGVFSADKLVRLNAKFGNILGDGDHLVFRGPGRMEISAQIPAEDYPDDPETSGSKTLFCREYRDFQRALDFAVSCRSTENSRGYLNGVAIDTENQCFVATEGRRLAKCDFEMPEGKEGAPGVYIVPNETLDFIRRLGYKEGHISAQVDDKNICFNFQGITIIQALVDGTFPRWQQVVPKDWQTMDFWCFEKTAVFLKALRNLATMKYDKTSIPSMQIQGSTHYVQITDGGNMPFQAEWGPFSCRAQRGAPGSNFSTCLATEYFLDAVDVMDSGISFYYDPHNPLAAVVLSDAPERFVVVMPRKPFA